MCDWPLNAMARQFCAYVPGSLASQPQGQLVRLCRCILCIAIARNYLYTGLFTSKWLFSFINFCSDSCCNQTTTNIISDQLNSLSVTSTLPSCTNTSSTVASYSPLPIIAHITSCPKDRFVCCTCVHNIYLSTQKIDISQIRAN